MYVDKLSHYCCFSPCLGLDLTFTGVVSQTAVSHRSSPGLQICCAAETQSWSERATKASRVATPHVSTCALNIIVLGDLVSAPALNITFGESFKHKIIVFVYIFLILKAS